MHIPFCERKCEYCDFYSVSGLGRQEEYTSALRREIRLLAERLPRLAFDTVFVGGGTPGLLGPELLRAVMAEVTACFDIDPAAEVTLEANPSSTTEARAEQWLAAGFNRVSVGVQSLEADILGFLGRVHDGPSALDALRAVRHAGFTAVNADLIYAVPGLDDERWIRTLERIIALEPDHISCYELTVEQGTPLQRAVSRGAVRVIDAERSLAQHWHAVDTLEAAGLRQYEISNFARPGQECRHNSVYWEQGYYLAAGVAAHGHLPLALADAVELPRGLNDVAVRYWHRRSLDGFIRALDAGVLPVDSEPIDAQSWMMEKVMVGLRTMRGIIIDDPRLRSALAPLADAGLIDLGDRVAVTRRGQEVLDGVIAEVVAACAA